ncbi:MAG: GNAT family N-acetyltransferase [Candidatus Thiodiazotropha sp. DIVDIV]
MHIFPLKQKNEATINTYSSIEQLANDCRQLAQQRQHRYLLRISGEQTWCVDQASQIIDLIADPNSLWVGEQAPKEIQQSSNQQALTYLGGECPLLIYNAYSGFDPDAFGALSGTLSGGGLLILLTPPLATWAEYSDPESERIAVAGCPLPERSRLLTRISEILKSDQSVAGSTPGQIGFWEPPAATPEPADRPDDQACLTQDQSEAVKAVIQVVKGHRKRPLVLTSDRGRGKSSALGIAAARLILGGYQRILVTASRQSAVVSLFEMAARVLNCNQSSTETLHHENGVIQYVAPDLLISEHPAADLVLVDEAATIPTPLLKKMLHHYPRIAFATTVHGYEGTGLGFTHRFKKHLQTERPQWRECILERPIRWAPNDPLERLIFRLLALDAEPVQDSQIGNLKLETLSVAFPAQQQLQEQENTLHQLFGLLVLAHYRTTPRDLWHLLDGPNLQTVILLHKQQVVAVALLASEGEFPSELAEEIWLGRRRPRGHLMAQSLSAHLGLRTASTLKGLRIMRIAVHPAVQNRGLGRHLLAAIKEHATTQGYDYLGVSFGVTKRLIRFWQNSDMHAVRLGLHSGASSSQQSVMFLQSLSHHGDDLLAQARKQYAKQLPALLNDSLSKLSDELVLPLLRDIETAPLSGLTDQDWLDVTAYAFANRGYEYTITSIHTLSLHALSLGQLNELDNRLLIKRVLQKQSWGGCADALGLPGRKAVEIRLRHIMQTVVLETCSESIRHLAQSIGKDKS